MGNTDKRKAYIAATTYAFITGLSFLFGKIGLTYSNPLDLLAFRFTVSFIVILIPVLSKKITLNYNWKNIKRILPLALLYPLAFFAFQTFGLQYATSSEAGILLAVVPVFSLVLASGFLRERTTLLQKLSILLSVTGVIYITIKNGATLDFKNIRGIILLLLSALSFAGYSVMARKLTKDFSNMELSFMMNTISFIVFNIMSVGSHIIKGTLGSFFNPLEEINFVLAVLYLGVLSSLVTSLLTNFALSKIETSKMGVFSNLGTVISIVAGVIFLKEQIFYYHILGSSLIVGGVIGTNFLGDRGKIAGR